MLTVWLAVSALRAGRDPAFAWGGIALAAAAFAIVVIA